MGNSGKRHGSVRLAETYAGLIRDKQWEHKFDQYQIFPHWQHLVDPEIAAHARPWKIVKDVLWLTVENSAWMQQLRFQKEALLETVNAHLKIARFSDIRLSLKGEKIDSRQGASKPPASVDFAPPAAEDIAVYRDQISFIKDEAVRESLLRLWCLAHSRR